MDCDSEFGSLGTRSLSGSESLLKGNRRRTSLRDRNYVLQDMHQGWGQFHFNVSQFWKDTHSNSHYCFLGNFFLSSFTRQHIQQALMSGSQRGNCCGVTYFIYLSLTFFVPNFLGEYQLLYGAIYKSLRKINRKNID